MVPSPPSRSSWVILGPLLLAFGVLFGWFLPNPFGRLAPKTWSAPPAPAEETPALNQGASNQGLPSLAPLVARVRDGVVGVRTILRPDAEPVGDGAAAEPGDEIENARRRGVVYGSGFVVHREGKVLVVTNQHVIAGYMQVTVEIPGRPRLEAEVVGEDPLSDLAVLRIQAPGKDLTVLPLAAPGAVRQGDWVVALGNPFQYRRTVTVGVVSYTGRHIAEGDGLAARPFLQFSAAVNPGSSGGPLVNMEGAVVGVTTRTRSHAQGISFAVPSSIVRWVLDSLAQHGEVRRGYLGARLNPVDAATARGWGLQGGAALVGEVLPDSPAAQAGLRAGDVVFARDGHALQGAFEFQDWITYAAAGEKVVLSLLRDRERQPPLTVQLAEVSSRPAKSEPAQASGDDATR